MATLARQRAQFTWALNQYNLSEDPETRTNLTESQNPTSCIHLD